VSIQQERPRGGRLNQAIANAIVRVHTQHFGRGPTKAQAFHRHNVVVVLMHGTLTQAERTLAESGQHAAVGEWRARFKDVIRNDATEAVEELTGCRVAAFLSASHVDPDMATELFVLDRTMPDDDELD
jgi:uncharacterized protein YbcI